MPAWPISPREPCARYWPRHEVKPHKVRYYLHRRDPEFAQKMAEVLCVYREVALLKQAAHAQGADGPGKRPRWRSFPTTRSPAYRRWRPRRPICRPEPMRHPTVARDHEYVRLGTLSLLAGIDLVTGVVHASVEERHRSREFVEFLKRLDAAYAPATAIKIILDNHSAHISKETRAWLAEQPEGRFTFVFTPKHGSSAQPRQRIVFQARPIRAPPHSRHVPGGTARANPRRYRPRKPRTRRPYFDVQDQRSGVIKSIHGSAELGT